MSRIIIISNRLPITLEKDSDGQLNYYPSAGGLATGLNSLDEAAPRLWIGWPGLEVEEASEQDAVRGELSERGMAPVFLSQEEIELFYEGFSNKTIWPLFHYFTQYAEYNEEYWKAYEAVNRKYAEVVSAHLRDDDLVWVHDYQLMLLPGMIREAHPRVSMGFFLHIPFPSYEVFRILPWREEVLRGLLGANLIGFHTFGYLRHFLSAVYRIVGHEHHFGRLNIGNRLVNVDVFPMGIDYEKYSMVVPQREEGESARKIRELARDKRLIISIDRLDYTKGIEQRLEGFRLFLHRHPEYCGKVALVLIVVPSRSGVDQYQELLHRINELVGEINGAYSQFDWTPVLYLYRSLQFEELTALYRMADIAMITPLRDGMNLVAKEFVASKESSKKGVLILSEMAGVANELTDAILVNPLDMNNLVEALERALSMSEAEQRWRLESMQAILKQHDVTNWANNFIQQQRKLMEEQAKQYTYLLGDAARKSLLNDYLAAARRLLIFDYDGTLMPFHPDPAAVSPESGLLERLAALSRVKGNKVVINSGRDRNTLNEWLGELGIDIAAEHGVWIKKGDEWSKAPNLTNGWKQQLRGVLNDMVERTPGSFVEEKEYSIAWHYRRVDRDFGERRVREFRDMLRYLTANLDLQVLEGNKVVEIKNAGVNKGHATLYWVNEDDWDFIMAIGDDHTDEDIFKALPESAYSIKVGRGSSAARFQLPGVEEVRDLLTGLANV